MNRDIALWKNPQGLTEDERLIVKRNWASLSPPIASPPTTLCWAPIATSPRRSAASTSLRQAFEEAIHTHAYQYIVESLGMDEGEIFNAYNEVKCIRDKDRFLIPFIDTLTDPEFKTGTFESDQALC